MKKSVFTVDVEGHIGQDPVKRLIFGITEDGTHYGIEQIMDICDKHHVRGLFFVDLAAAWHFGEEKIAEVMHLIASRGHDVGVHLHPDHMADPARAFLNTYSLEEQRDMISKCTSLYEKIMGQKPIAFRAGKYAANHDTLALLAEFGYKVDFSEYYGQKWCAIQPPVTGDRMVRLDTGLLEVPTTSYRSKFGHLYQRCDKIDANMPLCEYRYVMKWLLQQEQIDILVLFAHSFSLLNWRNHPNRPTKNVRARRRLEQMIRMAVQTEDVKMVSFRDLLVEDEEIAAPVKVDVPNLPIIPAAWFMLLRTIRVLKMCAEDKMVTACRR